LLFRLTPNQSLPQFNSAQFNLNAVIAARDNAARQIQALRATLASAQAQLDLNRINNKRYQYLASQGAVNQSTADQYSVSEKTQTAAVQNAREQLGAAQASYIQAVANVRKAKADAQTNQVAYNLNQVRSPIDGLVGNITLKAGDYVTTGQSLTTINQNNAFDLQIPIPINYAGQLQPGLTVELLDPNSGNQLGSGNIYFISSQTNSSNQTIQTRARFSNPNGRLRDGQYVQARIIWKTQPGILVPTEAVSPIGGQNFVYVATNKTDKNGKTQTIAQQIPVTLGSIQGQSYQVLKGLKLGNKVITTGVSRLRNGESIALRETNNHADPQRTALPHS
jgi:RND family efflux transporter MFP subunit